MIKQVYYEWCYETWDGEDVDEVDFEDKLENFQDNRKTEHLCLLRRVGSEASGEVDRLYAYVKSNILPKYFSENNGVQSVYKTPKRFHNELQKHLQ